MTSNRENAARTFRIAVRPNGATLANEHYIAHDVALAANDSTTLTLGITLDASDIITVRSAASAQLSVSVFGAEVS